MNDAECAERIKTLEHRLEIMVRASVAAWKALGYKETDAPGYDLAEAITRAKLKK